MRDQGSRWLALGVVSAVLTGLWWLARSSGTIGGPDERLADWLLVPIPTVFIVYGLLSLAAAHNDELPDKTPQQLDKRLTTWANDKAAIAGGFVWWSAFTFGLAFLFVVSLYPMSWSEAWVCHSCDDGTCCNIEDGGVLQYTLFVVLALTGSLYCLFGWILGIRSAVRLRRRQKLPRPIVEVDVDRVMPGGALQACVQLLGHGKVGRVRLALVCEEETKHSVGTKTSTDTEIVHRELVFEHQDLRLLGSKPLILTGAIELPTTAMHSLKLSHNQICWKLVLGVNASVELDESFEIQVPVQP